MTCRAVSPLPLQSGPQTLPAADPPSDRRTLTTRLFAQIADTHDAAQAKLLRDEVVIANMGVARAIASRFRDRGVSMDDLIQVAYVGLVNAVISFDTSYERDFLSFAVPSITGGIKRYFRDLGWTVRPPRRIQELQARISVASSELYQSLDRSPTPPEVARFLDIDDEQVIEAMAAQGCFIPASLDLLVGEDQSMSITGLLGAYDESLTRAEARLLLAPAVRALPPRDRRILGLRFFHGWTQDQIASELGVTQMQVSRLLSRILGALRTELDEPVRRPRRCRRALSATT
ncbi:MAG: sigma-70 family RNA polymerase sigma factor [Actinomycetota bacterium]|nr:sigma-70 family RNA polymerase sigma factor [Actinomycetota bacterium]